MHEVGKFLPHNGKFLDDIVPFFYIINLFMQSPFDDDFVGNNFVIQFYDFGMNIDNFTGPGWQLNVAHNIYLGGAIADNMLYLDALFILGNWLHAFHLLPPKRFVALSVYYMSKLPFLCQLFWKCKKSRNLLPDAD